MKQLFFRQSASLLLALVMAFSLALPASADEGDGSGGDDIPLESLSVSVSPPVVTQISSADNSYILYPAFTWQPTNFQFSEANCTYQWSVVSGEDVANFISTLHNERSITFRALTAGIAVFRLDVEYKDQAGNEKSCSADCTVTVPGVKLTSDSTLELLTHRTETLEANVFGEPENVAWETSNESVVTIVEQNVGKDKTTCTIRGVSPGDATVRLVAGNGDYSEEVRVSVRQVETPRIDKSADNGNPLRFSDILSEINSQCKEVLGEDLQYVSSLSVDTRTGTLFYGHISEAEPGYGVGSNENYYYASTGGERILGDVAFVPKADFSGDTVVTFTGFASSGEFYNGRVNISVTTTTTINYSTTGRGRIDFQMDDFSAACQLITGHELQCVSFTLPPSSKATLYYNYAGSELDNKVAEGELYYRAKTPYLQNVSLVPAEGYSGSFTIRYSGRDVSNQAFTGEVAVTVSIVGGGTGDISYSANKNRTVEFDVDDFNDLCRTETGYSLSYVIFGSLPASSSGTLYYRYDTSSSSRVDTSTRYYRNTSRYLDDVSFVPKNNWTGEVEIPFTGYSTNGDRFTGTVGIKIGSGSSGSSSTLISYSTRTNGSARFNVDDFNDMCLDQTGARLNYVRFDLPSSSYGTLYYNYSSSGSNTRVSASTSYYRNSSPYVDNISFVPATDWTGTVNISFTAYSVEGDRFSGTVEVEVGGNATSDTIVYTARQGSRVSFEASDFNDMCLKRTDERLNYVRFDLPASSRGTLYHNYTSASSTGTRVSAGSSYYRNSSPYLDDVSFVPASGWTGTVNISFTGYSVEGTRFTGTVKVTVEQAASAGVIYLSTPAGTPLTFQNSSFQSACSARGAGSFVSAAFTLPSASVGRLYQNYISASQPGTAVAGGQAYRASGSLSLSSVTFVPAAGYTGTATISYTGTDSGGATYSGTISISVSAPTTTSFTDLSGYAWASPSIEYLYANGIVNGTGDGKYSPAAPITRGSFMLMVCRAFHFSAPGSGSGFADVPANSIYADALRAAKAMGVAQGNGGNFYPTRPLSREQAAVFLLRALRANGWTIADGTRSSLSSFSDAASVSDYAVPGVGAMVQYNILQGSGGRLMPHNTLTRAQMAVILHRALTL